MIYLLQNSKSPILGKPAAEVESIDKSIYNLVTNMFETMYVHKGVGLAAPQVGISKQIFVFDVGQQAYLINPKISPIGKKKQLSTEGCLSLPGESVTVERFYEIGVTGLNLDGLPVRFTAKSLLAYVIQHEMDHLAGTLICDHENHA